MKIVLSLFIGGTMLCAAVPIAQAAPCLIVTLTGSGGGRQLSMVWLVQERSCSTVTITTTATR